MDIGGIVMKKWLVDDEPLFVLPTVAVKLGLNESIFLQQLHYWLGKSTHTHDGHVWVYNTYEGWKKQFPFWSESTIRRTIVRLEKKGIVVSRYRSQMDKTKWYRIDYDVLAKVLDTNVVHDEQVTEDDESMCIEKTNGQHDERTMQHDASHASTCQDARRNMNRQTEITTDHTLQNLIYFYEQNGFGTISSYVGEQMALWVNDTSAEWVLEALMIALKNGVKTWKYAEGILRNWKKHGRIKKEKRAVRTELIPEWLHIDYTQYERKTYSEAQLEQKRAELEKRLKKRVRA
ncbi:DnaD domain protein [Anoxybacillus flavithermus]|uniref:DnaD domain protein n=1 Tax=Anoxybacillus flavithermus TaxID=33934 RepID=UPI0018668761|nr:DnaD domain protein [Anoxybacillus flavithermus]MBE2907519.1 DnaD domain protein [Anoxybacillus flavithermus]MBE2909238.1 DnaD domain protein [Anoxybacillus flavithermus]